MNQQQLDAIANALYLALKHAKDEKWDSAPDSKRYAFQKIQAAYALFPAHQA